MNKNLIAFSIFLISCNSLQNYKIYQDSNDKYYIEIKVSDNNFSKDSIYIFHDFNNPSQIIKTGFYKDGFRNGLWSYNFSSGIKTINWGYYKDKYLNFETNIFGYADSAKYGSFYTKLLFNTESGKVLLSISVNSPIKDSFPQKNYKIISENEFIRGGFIPMEFKTLKLPNKPNDIYLNQIKVRISEDEIRYMKNAFSFIDKDHFVEISVSASDSTNIYENILFNGVITNFRLNGKLFYNPIKNR